MQIQILMNTYIIWQKYLYVIYYSYDLLFTHYYSLIINLYYSIHSCTSIKKAIYSYYIALRTKTSSSVLMFNFKISEIPNQRMTQLINQMVA